MAPFSAFAAVAGQFDLDVIFVIDVSGSMLNSDPNRLALAASNLFIDMCEDSDSRVGYVTYTHTITSSQPLTDITNFSTQLKGAIAATRYQSEGDTDTALGLEKAYELFKLDALDGKSARKPVIILLSDGNTDLPKPKNRTTEQSLSALEEIKVKLAEAGIPVYTIGFNYNEKLDVEAMNKIAEATSAMAQEAKTADELPLILRRIYGDLTGANSISFPATKATGAPQTVTIPIENESIYKATVTIMSTNPVKNITLTSPSGNEYGETDSSGKLTTNRDPSQKYTLLTLYRPEKGDWQLTFTGTKDDVVSIDLLSVYDLKLVMDIPAPSFDGTEISWQLKDEDGNTVSDPSLIDGLEVTLHANNDAVVEKFPLGKTSYTFKLAPGDYEAYLTMESGDIVRTSNVQKFTVPDGLPLSLKNPADNTVTIRLITLFKEESSFALDKVITFQSFNQPLTVATTTGVWEDFFDIQHSPSSSSDTLTVKALKSGNSEAEIIVTGNDGSSVSFYLNVKILSGWIFVIVAAVLLLLIAGIILLILYKRKPFLDTPMRSFPIQVNMPLSEIGNQPSEAVMRLEHRKDKRTLQQILEFNRAEDYKLAFQNIMWFPAGTTFKAKNASTLEVSIPSNSRFTAAINGKRVTASTLCQLTKNSSINVRLQTEDDEYEIILGSATQDDFSDPYDGDFGFGDTSSMTDLWQDNDLF